MMDTAQHLDKSSSSPAFPVSTKAYLWSVLFYFFIIFFTTNWGNLSEQNGTGTTGTPAANDGGADRGASGEPLLTLLTKIYFM